MLSDIFTFLVGLMGFIAFTYGLYQWQPIVAYILGGLFGMWYSWYVSIGAEIMLLKQTSADKT